MNQSLIQFETNFFEDNRDNYVEEDFGQDGEFIYSPIALDGICLYEPKRRQQK